MRHLFPHKRTYSSTVSFLLTEVDFSSVDAADKRDVYIRALAISPGFYDAYVVRTLAEANAIGSRIDDTNAARDAAGVMSYVRGAPQTPTRATVSLTNNAGIPPDLSSLGLTYDMPGSSANWDTVHGYVAAPAGIVLREVEAELEARTGSGQILEGYHSSRIKKGRMGVEILSRAKQIVASAATYESAVANSNEFAGAVNFSILVGALADKGEEYIDLIGVSGAIASLFADELIDLNGIIQGGIVLVEIEEPEEVSGEDEPYTAARINFRGNFPRLRSDR